MPLTGSELFPSIPTDTANAALLVIRNGNFYLSIGRLVNSLFFEFELDNQTIELQVSHQKIAMLYLITIFQFTEMLSDKQVAEALRKRVDWKYALHLPLDYDGLPETEICEFRQWMQADQRRKNTLQILLRRLSELTQAAKKTRLSTPNTDVISQICLINRLAIVWSQFSEVLRVLTVRYPTWLDTVYQPHWYQQYGGSLQALIMNSTDLGKIELGRSIGKDGNFLLQAISSSNIVDLQRLPEIAALKQIWREQFDQAEDRVLWRTTGCVKCKIPTESTQLNQDKISNEEVTDTQTRH